MPTHAPAVIGVDCSTTATKAVAFRADGSMVAQARRSYPRHSPRAGWQEQDPRHWWTATAGALKELTAVLAEGGIGVAALAITHQRETFACLDADGEPVRPAILWLDTRAGEQIARLGTPEVHALCGKPPSTTPSLYKLAWLADHEPKVLERTDLVVDVHGYLVRRLTGERLTSWAAADPLSLMDLQTFAWSPRLLSYAGVTAAQLPGLVPPGAVIGTVTTAAAEATGLPTGLRVVAGAGDGQCAGLGAGAVEPGVAYLNLGTGFTLGTHSDTYSYSRAYRTLASPLAGAYTLEALLAAGALSISWFRDTLKTTGREASEAELERMAASVPAGAGGLLFLPYLTSAETPHWDAEARACFIGLSDGHGLAEMYRAVLEGLAYEERLSLELIQADTGVRVERVRALGGAARSVLLTQILADVLDRPVELCDQLEATALGAAILAQAAVTGDSARAVAGRMTSSSTSRHPGPDLAPVQLGYGAYRQLYPALRDVFPLLSDLRNAGPQE
jgi:xylulokinase